MHRESHTGKAKQASRYARLALDAGFARVTIVRSDELEAVQPLYEIRFLAREDYRKDSGASLVC